MAEGKLCYKILNYALIPGVSIQSKKLVSKIIINLQKYVKSKPYRIGVTFIAKRNQTATHVSRREVDLKKRGRQKK